MTDEVLDALARIPLFAATAAASLTVTRLGGMTNRVYRVESPQGRWVLRLPGEGTEAYIDREAEAADAQVAAAAGVSAEVLYVDPGRGVMLTRFVDGTTLDAAGFKDLGSVRRAARALHRLHTCGGAFRKRFELFEQIDRYLALVNDLGAAVPEGYAVVKREADAVRQALAGHELPLVPCHCDPLAENFIDTGEQVVIVDWEYAGMNDPMWDLGDLSVEAAFGPVQDQVLLEAYFAGPAPPGEAARMVLYKAMCDLLWTLWGVVQHANGNPAEDFWAYATGRFERCRRLMGEAVFAESLQVVRAHPPP